MLVQFEQFDTEDLEERNIVFLGKYEAHLLRHPITGKWHIDVCEVWGPAFPQCYEELGFWVWGRESDLGDREFDTPEQAVDYLHQNRWWLLRRPTASGITTRMNSPATRF